MHTCRLPQPLVLVPAADRGRTGEAGDVQREAIFRHAEV